MRIYPVPWQKYIVDKVRGYMTNCSGCLLSTEIVDLTLLRTYSLIYNLMHLASRIPNLQNLMCTASASYGNYKVLMVYRHGQSHPVTVHSPPSSTPNGFRYCDLLILTRPHNHHVVLRSIVQWIFEIPLMCNAFLSKVVSKFDYAYPPYFSWWSFLITPPEPDLVPNQLILRHLPPMRMSLC